MNNNVIQLHQDIATVDRPWDDVPWFYGSIVSQVNEELLASEKLFHRRAKGLVEGINLIDHTVAPLAIEARSRESVWKAHDDQASHVPMLRAGLCQVLNLGIFAAELVLAATTFRGLGMDDKEIYITASGSVLVAFMLTKIVAGGLRWQPHRTEPAKKRQEAWMIGFAVATLALMLTGMGLARVTFSAAEAAASGGGSVSGLAIWGFTTLQTGLYFAQVAVSYFLLPANPVAHLARNNYLAANHKLKAALDRRASLAKQLNFLGNQLRAERDRGVEWAKRLMLAYIGALHRLDKGTLLQGLETTMRDDWFHPVVNLRVAESVDAAPKDVRAVLSNQP